MKFPKISNIATTDVIYVNIYNTVSEAIEKILEHEHRHVLVVDKKEYFIISVIDILNMKENGFDLETPLSKLKLKKVPVINKRKNVLDTLEFLSKSVEYICAINDDESLYGIVTHTDITSNIDPDTLMENYRLKDFLKLGRRMKWVTKDENVVTIVRDMAQTSYDNVVVVENLMPIGILTTKDIMTLIKTKVNLNVPVAKYMSHPVECLDKDSSIKEALNFIKNKHFKRVVITSNNGELSGIISQKELISLTYSKWAILMKEYQQELSEINLQLEDKNKEYEEIASTDSLTGVYNRYKFTQLYLSSYKSMIQRHNDMSLIMLDIDFFKKVNDTYGHNSGDKALVQVAHALLRNLRDIDIVCRWGGEEFIILLPTASLSNATVLAEKIRVYIQELDIDIVGHISASFGISQVEEGDTLEDVVSRADKALYLAKKSGRNCVKTQDDIKP